MAEQAGMRQRRRLAVLGVGLIAAVQPGVGATGLGVSAGSMAVRSPVSSCAPSHYRVRRGDTLSSIARRFHANVAALAAANSLDPNRVLPAGLVLVLPETGCLSLHAAPSTPGRDAAVAAALRRAVAAPRVSPAQTGVVVIDLESSSVIYALNPDTPLEPASTEKLPLATTLLQRLGAAFRIRTVVLGQGAQTGATWHGDLVLQGHGDPALTSAGLTGLARAVRARGIRAVSGSVVGDESYFDTERTAPGWKPSFAKVESPLLSALVVNRGLLDGAAVDHPALAAAILFTRALRAAGVSVSGSPEVGTAPSSAIELTRRGSPPLATLLFRMDTWSDNFIAEMLLKELGARLAGHGSSSAGAEWISSTLAAEGVPLAGVRLIDGSGLSRLDRLTARSQAAILETIWHEPKLRPLLDTFAIAGSTGTLRHRLVGIPGHQLVRGKTGTTDEASALAGFVGAGYAFVVLNNGSPVDWQAAHLMQDRVAEALLAAVA